MGNDFPVIFAVTGPLFAAAIGVEALALLADTAGNQHASEPHGAGPRHPIASFLLAIASLITPCVLMVYAWFAFNGHVFASVSDDFRARVTAVGLILGVMVAASILGWGLGRLGPARPYRFASLPLALIACALGLVVSWSTLTDIVDALREGRAMVVVPVIGAPANSP